MSVIQNQSNGEHKDAVCKKVLGVLSNFELTVLFSDVFLQRVPKIIIFYKSDANPKRLINLALYREQF